MNLNKIEAIFFDIDDTLLDSKKAQDSAIVEFKESFKEFKNVSKEEFCALWDRITHELYKGYLISQITFEQMRINRIKKLFLEFNTKLNDEEAKNYFEIYLKLYEDNWILSDEAITTLEKLKGKYKLGIISNGQEEQQLKKIDKTNIKQYFDEIIISSEIGISKPDKRIFEIACEKISVNPENALIIGDNYMTDILGAINSGLNAIWFNNSKENSKEIKYKYQINNLSEILNFIN